MERIKRWRKRYSGRRESEVKYKNKCHVMTLRRIV